MHARAMQPLQRAADLQLLGGTRVKRKRHIGAGDSDTFNLKRGDAPFVELACGAEVARPRSGTKANKQRETVRPVRSTFCALQSPVKMDSDG
jgi:hypothetical protein